MRALLTLEQCWHRVPGGVAVVAVELARALAERSDVEVEGIAARHGAAPPADGFAPPVPVHQLALPRPALYEAWHTIGHPVIGAGADVVHATTIICPPTGRTPLVVTMHDLAFLAEPDHFTARANRMFRRGWDLIRQRADLVLCVSRATADSCVEAGLDETRIRVVPNGVRVVEASDADARDVARRLGVPDAPYVLFAGTLEPRKNLPRLLEAMASVEPEVNLMIAGPAGWGASPAPQAAALGDRVRLLGHVAPDDLRALYRGAAVCAYPSLREGFGLPVLEAMAQGCPVVTSRGTATEEVAGGAAVLVDPLDVDSIAYGIGDALARPAELAAAGRVRAAEMSWDRSAELVVAAYREVTGR